MKRSVRLISLLVFALASITTASSQSSRFILEASGLRDAAPPEVIGDHILLSYRFADGNGEGQIHTVAAAFEHESFSTIHPYSRNQHGVFVLAVPRDPDIESYRYRIVVDGVWTIDPNAPLTTTDRWGVSLSEFHAREGTASFVAYPRVLPDGFVEFRVRATSGGQVALVGSFNGWDPFMTPLVETEPGLYSRTVRLPSGEHLYYFMMDGMRVPDPSNGRRRAGAGGQIVSVVELP